MAIINSRLWQRIAAGSLLLNLLLAIILFTPVVRWLTIPLIVDDPVPTPRQLIVVMANLVHPSGMPSFRAMVRMRKGADLYRAGIAPRILVLGGPHPSTGPSDSQAMVNSLARYERIPEADLLVQDETSHTYADIVSMIQRWQGRIDLDQAVFVTSAYHTYRVKHLLLRQGLRSPVVSADPVELYPLPPGEQLGLFREVAREYLAIVYSRLKGWL